MTYFKEWDTPHRSYQTLITVPAADGNFIAALGYATDEELIHAREYLSQNQKGNLSRLAAVKREIRKRGKQK